MKMRFTPGLMVVGWSLSAVFLVTSFWRMVLDRPLTVASGSGLGWFVCFYMALIFSHQCELARLKKALGGAYPEIENKKRYIVIASGVTAAILCFILR